MIALARYEANVHACGFHASVLEDKTNFIQPEWHKCAVCAVADQYARVQLDEDDGALKARHGDAIPPKAPRPGDGRSLMLRQLSPAEVEEIRAKRASPSPSPSRGR